MRPPHPEKDSRAQLLSEINKLANQARDLRAVRGDPTKIKSIDDRLRGKWAELRALRAGAPSNPPPPRRFPGERN